MSRPHRDSRGYYRALGVSPQASDEEIRLAYEMVRGTEEFQAENGANYDDIDRAWMVLKIPPRRRQYDDNETRGRVKLGFKVKLDDPRLLAACVVVLVGILCFVWVPLYGSRFRSFAPGDSLVDLSGRPFGTVVRTEERHGFPGGLMKEGFLIEQSGNRELRWYPADDIRALCRKPAS